MVPFKGIALPLASFSGSVVLLISFPTTVKGLEIIAPSSFDFEQEKMMVGGNEVEINQNMLEAAKHFTMLRSDRALGGWSSHARLYVTPGKMAPYLRVDNGGVLPMLPIQLIVQNLLYSISQLSIPWDTMDEEYIKEPRKWNADDIGKFMIYIGPISSIFDIVTFLVMWFVFKANSIEMQSLFQSGWFIEGLLSQTLIVHMIRTKKIPFIQSRAAKPVLILTGIVMTIGIAIPFTSFGKQFGLVPLPPTYFIWLVMILLSYSILTQVVKNIYIKKFNRWV